MGVRCAVNGFGRVGRYLVRAAIGCDDIEIVAVNSRAKSSILAHLLKYDSVHGKFPGEVSFSDKALVVNGREIRITNITDNCALLPWRELGVGIVLESTGEFRKKAEVAPHLAAGAKKVIIAAPGKGIDGTFVMGVNEETYDAAKHHVISNASCTTNCLAPVVKVLHDAFGVERGFMTTIHAYTNDQKILDAPHKDLRRARAAAVSQIPTTTGAAKAVGLVIPELKGKIDGIAIRVPTPNVSLVDLVAVLKKPAKAEEINAAFVKAAEGALKGILGYTDEPLVSVDFMHDR